MYLGMSTMRLFRPICGEEEFASSLLHQSQRVLCLVISSSLQPLAPNLLPNYTVANCEKTDTRTFVHFFYFFFPYDRVDVLFIEHQFGTMKEAIRQGELSRKELNTVQNPPNLFLLEDVEESRRGR